MNPRHSLLFSFLAILSLQSPTPANPQDIQITSPDGQITATFHPNTFSYQISYQNHPLLPDSPLGLTFEPTGPILPPLTTTQTHQDSLDETYPLLAGKSSTARNHYNQTTISLSETTPKPRQLQLIFRAYDDGIAFRYNLPAQPAMSDFVVTSEDTGFSLPSSAKVWMMPMPQYGGDHFEFNYTPESSNDLKPNQFTGFPLLAELPNHGPALAILEANLNDYPGMRLRIDDHKILRTFLTPLPGQQKIKVRSTLPHTSPWRVIMIGPSAGKLIESNLITNLNDPCALTDTSWIHPGKVIFPWWNGYLVGKNGKPGAVNTATYNHYVDGAAELGFPYSSIDGLDIAWYGGKIPGYGENDITVPVPALDIQSVLAHAKQKHIRIRLWVASAGMHKYLDKALDTYAKWGVEGIMVDFIERDDQQGINWLREMVAKAAQHHLTVTLHNVSPPTGLSRTYPNLLTRESVRNQEYDKWDPNGITPEHNLTVPFTRMLAGHLDYHVGAFRSVLQSDFNPRDVAPDVMGSRCHQLAMYVIYDDPMPMAVDYPAAYRNRPGIDFLTSVPTTWDQTLFLGGQVADFLTLARRKGADWYIATMNTTPRQINIPLTFLSAGNFTAELWSDNPPAGPNSLTHTTQSVTSKDTLTTILLTAGGQVIHLKPTP
ncbi:MAG TPA: glycoside hydrolase family 97 protein [Tepidisphaeraceae bacterium]|jgi:alpha-glucosidase|nr:glycoside hydrolase family 97 protein [Tepidisphaeraceae bacterium]